MRSGAVPTGDPVIERLLGEAVGMPDAARDYFVAGSADQLTAAAAADAWRELRFAPHVLRDVSAVDTSTTLLGEPYSRPFGVAPTSMQRAAHDDGELAMARAAAAAELPHVVSCNAGHRFADIAAAGDRWWLQAYLPTDREAARGMLEAAVAAGAGAVVLTADAPVIPSKPGSSDAEWADVDHSWHRVNYPGDNARLRGAWAADLGPADVAWLAEVTGLPVVVKGVLRGDDARRCVAAGASAIWISNHGGRQLDRSVSTAAALPGVLSAVGPTAEVYVDGGIRGGLDVLAAVSMGARAAFLGRVPLLALAAGGQTAVTRELDRVGAELVEAMSLAGCRDLAATRGLTYAG